MAGIINRECLTWISFASVYARCLSVGAVFGAFNAFGRSVMFRPAALCLLLSLSAFAGSALLKSLPAGYFSYGGTTSASLENGVLHYKGDVTAYSGFFLPFADGKADFSDREHTFLEMDVRLPKMRTEPLYIGLETMRADSVRFYSKLPVARFIALDTLWRNVRIPLSLFSDLGESWDRTADAGADGLMEWKDVIGVRFSSDPVSGRSTPVEVLIKSLKFSKGQGPAIPPGQNFQGKLISAPVLNFFDGTLLQGMTHYAYGGVSIAHIYPDKKVSGKYILSFSLSDDDYSGGAFLLPRTFDASARDSLALLLWVKSNSHSATFNASLMDDDSDGKYKTVETHVLARRFANVGEKWTRVIIPLREFPEIGCWWNPESHSNVVAKMDWSHLSGVRFITDRGTNNDLPEGEEGMLKLYFAQIALIPLPDSLKKFAKTDVQAKEASGLRYNQVGYATDASKIFLATNSDADRFLLLDSTGKKVMEGPLVDNGAWAPAGEWVKSGDFSEWKKPGTYSLWVDDSLQSKLFRIGGGWLAEQPASTVKAFYYQRSGEALPASEAGKWARPAAHLDDHLQFSPTIQRSGTWKAHSGWDDAGDYGTYIVNGGSTLATLLFAEELFPQALQRTGLRDEIRFELEWFLRMQDADGGVFFKVAPLRWDDFVSPSESKRERFVMGKSTTSSLNFAAALAQAHGLFKAIDPQLAERCLKAAEKAYQWSSDNPDVSYPRESGGSGLYDDSHYGDEFFWARAMLFRETGDQTLLKQIRLDAESENVTSSVDWPITQNFAWFALALQSRDGALRNTARAKLEAMSESIVANMNASPYRMSEESLFWGSNGRLASIAMTVALTNTWEKSAALRNVVSETVDYLYGRNPVGICFVTGAAASSPKHPHHRISGGDGIEEPVPGFLVGGINVNREDDISKDPDGATYTDPRPGKSYVDEQGAYACNEIAINWNAPLVFILASLGK